MKLFGQIIRTVVNVATLPVDIVVDAATSMVDVVEKGRVGDRTRDKIEKIKEEAQEE